MNIEEESILDEIWKMKQDLLGQLSSDFQLNFKTTTENTQEQDLSLKDEILATTKLEFDLQQNFESQKQTLFDTHLQEVHHLTTSIQLKESDILKLQSEKGRFKL